MLNSKSNMRILHNSCDYKSHIFFFFVFIKIYVERAISLLNDENLNCVISCQIILSRDEKRMSKVCEKENCHATHGKIAFV